MPIDIHYNEHLDIEGTNEPLDGPRVEDSLFNDEVLRDARSFDGAPEVLAESSRKRRPKIESSLGLIEKAGERDDS